VKIVAPGTNRPPFADDPAGFVPVVRLWLDSSPYLLMSIDSAKVCALPTKSLDSARAIRRLYVFIKDWFMNRNTPGRFRRRRKPLLAELPASLRKDELLEQIVTRLSLEPGVTTIRWEIVSASDSAPGGVPALDE
jgi:hypothetical protein